MWALGIKPGSSGKAVLLRLSHLYSPALIVLLLTRDRSGVLVHFEAGDGVTEFKACLVLEFKTARVM